VRVEGRSTKDSYPLLSKCNFGASWGWCPKNKELVLPRVGALKIRELVLPRVGALKTRELVLPRVGALKTRELVLPRVGALKKGICVS
jgi:hypothetical protein